MRSTSAKFRRQCLCGLIFSIKSNGSDIQKQKVGWRRSENLGQDNQQLVSLAGYWVLSEDPDSNSHATYFV